MERGLVIFGVIFLLVPLLLAAAVLALPGMAFGLTLALVAVLSLGFFLGLAFLDLNPA